MSGRIGLEIKLLRERLKLSAKDVAEHVGLSPSQMSRLESGQRRVDAVMLSKIARVLGVHPSYFFQDFDAARRAPGGPEPPAEAEAPGAGAGAVVAEEATTHVGRVIRTERRLRHVTAEELAQRIGKGRSFVLDVEAGRTELLSGEVLGKIARALKLEPEPLFEAQRAELRELRRIVARLERAHAEVAPLGAGGGGAPDGAGGADGPGIPLVEPPAGGLPDRFEGRTPVGRVVDHLRLPRLRLASGFAVTWTGHDMEPDYRPGDVLVFATDREARPGDRVLAVVPAGPLFRALFHEPDGRLRLQPLNLAQPPSIVEPDGVTALFPLAARVTLC